MADVGAAPGEAIVVRLVADGFVEVDDRRMPVEECVYELRLRCRAAEDAGIARPALRVVMRSDAGELGATVDALRSAAYDAGVTQVELAMEGA